MFLLYRRRKAVKTVQNFYDWEFLKYCRQNLSEHRQKERGGRELKR